MLLLQRLFRSEKKKNYTKKNRQELNALLANCSNVFQIK